MQSDYAQNLLAELLLAGTLPKSCLKASEIAYSEELGTIELKSFVLIERLANAADVTECDVIQNDAPSFQDCRLYTKTDAALRIAKKLDNAWFMFNIFRLVPACIRDAVYDCIAKNRYRWFGKRKECRIPTASEASRFVK